LYSFSSLPGAICNLCETIYVLADFISKVKDKAENVGQSIQAKVDSAGIKIPSPRPSRRTSENPQGDSGASSPASSGLGGQKPPRPPPLSGRVQFQDKSTLAAPTPSCSAALVAAQILMSCLHAWGLDPDLDRLCTNKLGLLRPRRPIVFGFLSRSGGHMSLSLPGWYRHFGGPEAGVTGRQSATVLATAGHWQLSSAVTTQHLLAVIAVANTLMSMSNATFVASRRTTEPLAQLPK
jgi:hypothetical protein